MKHTIALLSVVASMLVGCSHYCCQTCDDCCPGGHCGPGLGLGGGHAHNLPPANMVLHPGPGVDGPGPGVMMGAPVAPLAPPPPSQIAFVGPSGMVVNWNTGGGPLFSSDPLVAPGRFDFPQGAIYRLKLTNVPGRPGVELYPTLEVGPALPRTEAYLAHNAIPVQFTKEDFDQVLSGNFVTKVIYLPDPEFQGLAIAGAETLVSTRLDPGIDPIIEADRRGAIMAIIRLGNKDLQLPVAGGGNMINPVSHQEGADGDGGPTAGGPGPGGMPGMPGMPPNMPMPAYGPPSTTPSYISGVTSPQYGMPYTGTPIGLPGPPHIPLGIPAGLQRHTMHNHTHMRIPGPTAELDIHATQHPGFTYPKPVRQIRVNEFVKPGPAPE